MSKSMPWYEPVQSFILGDSLHPIFPKTVERERNRVGSRKRRMGSFFDSLLSTNDKHVCKKKLTFLYPKLPQVPTARQFNRIQLFGMFCACSRASELVFFRLNSPQTSVLLSAIIFNDSIHKIEWIFRRYYLAKNAHLIELDFSLFHFWAWVDFWRKKASSTSMLFLLVILSVCTHCVDVRRQKEHKFSSRSSFIYGGLAHKNETASNMLFIVAFGIRRLLDTVFHMLCFSCLTFVSNASKTRAFFISSSKFVMPNIYYWRAFHSFSPFHSLREWISSVCDDGVGACQLHTIMAFYVEFNTLRFFSPIRASLVSFSSFFVHAPFNPLWHKQTNTQKHALAP